MPKAKLLTPSTLPPPFPPLSSTPLPLLTPQRTAELLSRYGVAIEMTHRHDDILKAIRAIARQVEAASVERSSWSVAVSRGARGEILPGFSEVCASVKRDLFIRQKRPM